MYNFLRGTDRICSDLNNHFRKWWWHWLMFIHLDTSQKLRKTRISHRLIMLTKLPPGAKRLSFVRSHKLSSLRVCTSTKGSGEACAASLVSLMFRIAMRPISHELIHKKVTWLSLDWIFIHVLQTITMLQVHFNEFDIHLHRLSSKPEIAYHQIESREKRQGGQWVFTFTWALLFAPEQPLTSGLVAKGLISMLCIFIVFCVST